jgi:hypothetical protein
MANWSNIIGVTLTYCDQHERDVESNDEAVPLRYIAA